MKITFLSPPPNLTGGQRVIAVYAKKLTERGHEVNIVCTRRNKIPFRRKVKSLFKGNGWPGNFAVKGSHYQNYGVKYLVAGHRGPMKNSDIPPGDIIVATFWPTAYQAVELGSNRGIPVYLVQHDEGTVWHKKADETYDLPMLQVCVSNWVANNIRNRHPGANQVVINNSVELGKFRKGPVFEKRQMRFGFMYSKKNWKRSDLAIEALNIARNRMQSISAVTIGVDFDKPIPSWIDQINNPDSDTLCNVYGSCRAWLFSSDIEGFGLPILESMACGTPVIGTSAGAAPELIAKGGGILVPFNDAPSMAEAILKICSLKNEQWQAMADAAYKTANDYTWDDATDLLESTLFNLF